MFDSITNAMLINVTILFIIDENWMQRGLRIVPMKSLNFVLDNKGVISQQSQLE